MRLGGGVDDADDYHHHLPDPDRGRGGRGSFAVRVSVPAPGRTGPPTGDGGSVSHQRSGLFSHQPDHHDRSFGTACGAGGAAQDIRGVFGDGGLFGLCLHPGDSAADHAPRPGFKPPGPKTAPVPPGPAPYPPGGTPGLQSAVDSQPGVYRGGDLFRLGGHPDPGRYQYGPVDQHAQRHPPEHGYRGGKHRGHHGHGNPGGDR